MSDIKINSMDVTKALSFKDVNSEKGNNILFAEDINKVTNSADIQQLQLEDSISLDNKNQRDIGIGNESKDEDIVNKLERIMSASAKKEVASLIKDPNVRSALVKELHRMDNEQKVELFDRLSSVENSVSTLKDSVSTLKVIVRQQQDEISSLFKGAIDKIDKLESKLVGGIPVATTTHSNAKVITIAVGLFSFSFVTVSGTVMYAVVEHFKYLHSTSSFFQKEIILQLDAVRRNQEALTEEVMLLKKHQHGMDSWKHELTRGYKYLVINRVFEYFFGITIFPGYENIELFKTFNNSVVGRYVQSFIDQLMKI